MKLAKIKVTFIFLLLLTVVSISGKVTAQNSINEELYDFWIKVPEKGQYQFSRSSDDGSVLYIDEKKIVDNDGSHSFQTKTGTVGPEKGFHKIKIQYFESYIGN